MKNLRQLAVALLVIAGCINFIDRSAVSIALPAIRTDLHLSEAEAGLLLSAFAWSYAVAQLPAGSLLDRVGARWALAGALGVWSCVQAASGLVSSLPQFIAARVALGLGESPMFVGGARVVADRFDPADRALPLGMLNASASLGPAIAPLLLTPLMVLWGWRAAFVALGAAGLLMALAWALIYRDLPAREAAPRIAGPVQWRRITASGYGMGPAAGFRRHGLHHVAVCDMATRLPRAALAHGPARRCTLWSSVPQLAGFIGAIGGGFLSDRLARWTGPRTARQAPLVAGLLVSAAGSAFAAISGSATLALTAISIALFSANIATTGGWALAATLAPAALIATVEAMANIGGSIGGSLAPLITGVVVERSGSFAPALLLAAAVATLCAAGNWLLTRREITEA